MYIKLRVTFQGLPTYIVCYVSEGQVKLNFQQRPIYMYDTYQNVRLAVCISKIYAFRNLDIQRRVFALC